MSVNETTGYQYLDRMKRTQNRPFDANQEGTENYFPHNSFINLHTSNT